MIGVLIVAAVIAGVYAALIALHVATIRGGAGGTGPERPRVAVWLAARFGRMPEAAPVDRELSRSECETVRRLLDGTLDRAAYRSAMSTVAARDAADRPLDVPEIRQ